MKKSRFSEEQMANHKRLRTTWLYDRRQDQVLTRWGGL